MDDKNYELQKIANEIRLSGLRMAKKAGSGHLGGAFSLSEILSVLYFDVMNIDPKDPSWQDRDRFVMSKGHATVALYPTLAKKGFFAEDRLNEFRRIDGGLSGHVEKSVPGVDASTGSLGQGFSVGVGMALSGKLFNKDFYTYVICGDGEIQEGQVWEAAEFAPNHNLSHLILIIDNNKLQLDGPICEICNLRNIGDKFRAFGWNVIDEIDGHNVASLRDSFNKAKKSKEKPTVIVANTVKGKGVSFMENNYLYHGAHPDAKGFELAEKEIIDSINA